MAQATQDPTNILKKVTVYCDGSCLKNPGQGGWGCILLHIKKDGTPIEKELSGGEPDTTNNRMEILAAIQGLKAIKYPCQVEIHTDSQYLIKVMTGGKRKANTDLLSTLDELCQTHQVSWVHVKGHSGNEMNERCDQLAKRAATAIVPQPTN
jgi:ribonuclease HI